jgi:hypothetical protein
MQVTVKFVNPAKEGKKFSNIKGQDDVAYFFKKGAFEFNKGSSYDLDLKDEKWGDSHVKVIQGVKTAAAPAAPNGGEHTGLTEAELRFVSNIVGSAIEAGKCSEPDEVSLWAKAARATLKELA